MGYVYIFLTILFTVYGQLVLKWKINEAGQLPAEWTNKILFLFKLLLNPWIFSGFLSAFIAALAWMAAMTKLDLSHAYPFMGLTFILIMVLSGVFFNESITPFKIFGIILISAGIIVSSQG